MTNDVGLIVRPNDPDKLAKQLFNTEHALYASEHEIVITKAMVSQSSEEELKSIREHNRECMANTYKRGALELPTGIPINCKVDQPGARIRPEWNCKQNDMQWTNGELRIRYINGQNKYEYHMGFAGRARAVQDMNSGE